MALLNKKLQASSLVESLIAMVIIIACFSIAVLIYSSVIDSDKELSRVRADLWMDEVYVDTIEKDKYVDEETTINGYKLVKTVGMYKNAENVYQLNLKVVDAEGIIIKSQDYLIPEYK